MFIFCPGMATALAPSGLRLETLVLATVTGKTWSWLFYQVKFGLFSSDLLAFFLLLVLATITGKIWSWLL